jgi:hypothetical protein
MTKVYDHTKQANDFCRSLKYQFNTYKSVQIIFDLPEILVNVLLSLRGP